MFSSSLIIIIIIIIIQGFEMLLSKKKSNWRRASAVGLRKGLGACRMVARAVLGAASEPGLASGRLMSRGHAPQPWDFKPARELTKPEYQNLTRNLGLAKAMGEAEQIRKAIDHREVYSRTSRRL